MLQDVKLALRISNNAYDNEVSDLIESARLDLIQSGVSSSIVNDTNVDPLIKRAIITYCKAHFGYDNPEADRFHDAYIMLKQHLSLAGDYRAVE
jgi:uncharacterized phage protein (predicted DNA packaging)